MAKNEDAVSALNRQLGDKPLELGHAPPVMASGVKPPPPPAPPTHVAAAQPAAPVASAKYGTNRRG